MASVADTYFARSQKPKPLTAPAPYDPNAGNDAQLAPPNLEGGGEGLEPLIPGGGPGDNPGDGVLIPPGGGGGIDPPPPVEPIDPPPLYAEDPLEPPAKHPDVPPTGGGDVPLNPNDPPANGDLGKLIAGKLSQLFGRSINPDENDPQFRGLINANRHAGDRNLARERALLAERASVEGTADSGGFDTNLLGLAQDQGAKDQAFQGNLLAEGGKNRVQEIMQALQLASGNQNANNQLGLSYAQLVALLNAQGLSGLLNGV